MPETVANAGLRTDLSALCCIPTTPISLPSFALAKGGSSYTRHTSLKCLDVLFGGLRVLVAKQARPQQQAASQQIYAGVCSKALCR